MESLSHTLLIKNQIQFLETEQKAQGDAVKEQFKHLYESFKPINILKRTFSDVAKSPSLITKIVGTAIGLSSGFLTRKMFVGASVSLIRKFLGTILQLGVTNVVAQHTDSLKSVGQFLLRKIIHRNENTNR